MHWLAPHRPVLISALGINPRRYYSYLRMLADDIDRVSGRCPQMYDQTYIMRSGIYRITNVTVNKVYIGSSIDIQKRLSNHRHHLCRGKHHNKLLQADWKQYGAEAFVFESIEEIHDEDALAPAERRWIRHYRDSLGEPNVYNAQSLANRWSKDERMRILNRIRRPFQLTASETAETLDQIAQAVQSPLEDRSMSIFVEQDGPASRWLMIVHCSICDCPMTVQYRTFKIRLKGPHKISEQKLPGTFKCHSCRTDPKRRSATSKRLWKKHQYRQNIQQGKLSINENERRAKISDAMKRYFADPNAREALARSLKNVMRKKSGKISKAMIKKWGDQRFRDAVSDSNKQNAAEFWKHKIITTAESKPDLTHFKEDLNHLMDRFEH
jgi:hypothetical protein